MSSADERVVTTPVRLDNTVQHYAWGSRSLLAELRGEQPSVEREAEIWMGAHPAAPSRAVLDGRRIPLDVLLAEHPELLGATRGADTLPFLLKLLAADEPLSLQAHPTIERAREGFARENAEGIALDDATRSYKDDNHKPELICALTPFRALSGFRDVETTSELLRSLDSAELEPVLERIDGGSNSTGLVELVEHILTLDPDAGARLGRAVGDAVRRDGPFPAERALGRRIAEVYPDDPGIVIALLLELVTLEPGEAIYLGAGRLHAYVDGLGVEIMAASDNVLRGGLTPKHVDVAELVATLDPVVLPIEVLRGESLGGGEYVYPTPAPEFELSRIVIDGSIERHADGPEIVVAVEGELSFCGSGAAPTDAWFVPAGVSWDLTGRGTAFRARIGGRNT